MDGIASEKRKDLHDVPQIRRNLSATDKTTPGNKCFDLEIRVHARDADGGTYAVEAKLGNGGHFTWGELRLNMKALRKAVLDPQAVGQHLSDALFTGPIRDAYLKAATYAETLAENCLRLRLWIDRDAADLHALSWELLRVNDIMVSANAATPFSRYLPVSAPWETDVTARPLRVLAAISNPTDLEAYRLPPVNVEAERALLEQALADQNVQLDFLKPPVTLSRLETKLREGYHVLHYVGHGAVGKERGEPVLYLQQEDERAALVKGRQISAMLARQGVRPHLVVLAACESATVATEDAYVALGPQLIRRGVPAVVAMRGRISQASARTFSRTLYERLLVHGVVDLAMNEARSTLITGGRADAVVPVLFMRLKDGRLWRQTATHDGSKPTHKGDPMTDLRAALKRAQRALEILEERAAGYTALTIPAHLKIELEEKRREVAALEERLAQSATDATSTPLPGHTINIVGDGNVIGHHSSSQVNKENSANTSKSASTRLDTASLRQRLQHLDSTEIEALCMDYFPGVYGKFSRGLRRDEMINLLLDHCRRHPEDAARLNALL